MQFMNSSLEKLVRNLSDNDFKYLTEELNEYMDSLKDLVKKSCLIENVFIVLQKIEQLVIMVEN